ncbi:MAG: GNAT family N-acyltransferase [Paracoccaceae bacterium]|nr:GNAT family N-acyltransferase [Paracoccaceae bacterium]
MIQPEPFFSVRLAQSAHDRYAAQRLRYRVFIQELGGDGPLVDHENQFETDQFDAFCDHLILVDERRNHGDLDHVVGVYRLLRGDQAVRAGRFYSEAEYNLCPLLVSERKLLELGRSCVHPACRHGTAMYRLWSGLAAYVSDHKIDILFGVASFHGTDLAGLAAPLSLLYSRYLAPPELRVRAHKDKYQAMNILSQEALDRRRAMLQVPALIKAYLRLGGFVGEGAYVDHAFNTTDVCLVMDAARLNARHIGHYMERPVR